MLVKIALVIVIIPFFVSFLSLKEYVFNLIGLLNGNPKKFEKKECNDSANGEGANEDDSYMGLGYLVKKIIKHTVILGVLISILVAADAQDDANYVEDMKNRSLDYDHLAVVQNSLSDGIISDREEGSFEYFRKEDGIEYKELLKLLKDEGYGNSEKVDKLFESFVTDLSVETMHRPFNTEFGKDKMEESLRLAKMASAFDDGSFDATEIQIFRNEYKKHDSFYNHSNLEMLSILGDVEYGAGDVQSNKERYVKMLEEILEQHNFLGGDRND